MADILDELNQAMKGLRTATPVPATAQAHIMLAKALYEIERMRRPADNLQRCLNGRDKFIVERGLFEEFLATLPKRPAPE